MTTAPDHSSTHDSPERFNIASHLPQMARKVPDHPAVVVTSSYEGNGRAVYRSITFAELEALSNRFANGMIAAGLARGMRVLVMVRPGIDFMGLIFALFKMGAVPVLIDPGMGIGRMMECIRGVDLHGFIGIPLAHAMRVLRPGPFRSVRCVITVGRRWFWGGPTLTGLARTAAPDFATVDTAADETAAILFTSGSTGPAKGVVYEHGMFGAQVRQIQQRYGIEPGETDLPTFPLFGLFSIAMGMTTVIPDMDPAHPAKVDPAKIIGPILDHRVTNTFGSPALWRRVAAYGTDHNVRLPSLRRILIAGAPVPYPVIRQLHDMLRDEADVHTPYGATESLPVSSISGREVLGGCTDKTRTGAGTCVGTTMPEIDLRVITVTDQPIAEWSSNLLVPDGEIGEIVVSGPVVTKEYFGLPNATALAKIRDGERIWHRIGDLGYRDKQGRIWFCGRKGHRVQTSHGPMFTVPCEAIFNEHRQVSRSALVGVGPPGAQSPVIVVEPKSPTDLKGGRGRKLQEELLELARGNELTRSITRVLLHRSLPVDIRHNTKINREQLADWAERQAP